MSDQPPNYEVTIETLGKSELISFVAAHPEIISLRFWHGQSVLHKACLRPDACVDVIRCLVEAGADVNAANNFEETPLMFAAKRGSSSLCQYLLDNSANQDLCDKAGRSVIHHAVMGGSVYLVHYLLKVHDFKLEVEDSRNQTPLHVACSQGNLVMVNYLLRSMQCDSKKADMFGNTALHHAATYGHSQVVTSLILHSGLSILDAVNKKGQTAVDVCKGKGSTHLATNQAFRYAQQNKNKGLNNLQLPRFLWFWYLVMPLVFFVCGGLIAELVQALCGWYSGSVVSSGFLIYILYLFQVHSHRIKHFTRLPNPMHAGAFGAGLIGTFVVWLVAVLPKLHVIADSVNFVVCALTFLCVPPTYYLYWKLLSANPGYLALPDKGMPMSAAMKVALRSDETGARFCAYCDSFSSGSHIKHCKLCERCVVHMDHHCLFLLKCVAKNNHRLFTIFIFIANVDIILFLISSYRCFYQLYGEPSTADVISRMASENNFVLFVIILNTFSCLWGVMLLQWQLRLISEGHTFYDSIREGQATVASAHAKPPLSVRFRNLVRFFTVGYNSSTNVSSV